VCVSALITSTNWKCFLISLITKRSSNSQRNENSAIKVGNSENQAIPGINEQSYKILPIFGLDVAGHGVGRIFEQSHTSLQCWCRECESERSRIRGYSDNIHRKGWPEYLRSYSKSRLIEEARSVSSRSGHSELQRA